MTELFDLFKEALKYPTNDYKALLIFGVIFLIANLYSVFTAWGIELDSVVIGLLSIISIILYFVTEGYALSVVRESLDLIDEIPAFNIIANFVDGLKLFVVQIAYYIIPTILVLIVGWLSGTFYALFNIVEYLGQDFTSTSLNTTTISFNAVPQEYWSALAIGLVITAIFAMILFIIFGLLLGIAECRLAKYDSIGEALNIREVIEDIKKIGIGRYIGWYILLFVITMIISFVLGFINAIPYIGVLIGFLVGTPFITLFGSRALGALYSDVE
ncbi:Protein of unknown function [Methanobrevibacter olleyae]|uniref:DUF4013 domain-containing protein n=1 Tax=Methanobrevibacter olleyae TaxID=294671 RepID=A0A1I4K3T2_METOL|nr:DUF4013 domain-containing protein [Methanobrevibacter olleyae]SFL73434.1 Protein of unknown function [Methanobrevibacter olleyae]